MATIYHQVWIDAPIAKVYAAIATPEGIGRWWDQQTLIQTERGPVLAHDPGAEHGTVELLVVEQVPNRRIEWECISRHPPHTPAASWTGTHICFQLIERTACASAQVPWAAAIPAQTILDFRHTGWNEGSDYFGFCSFAWGAVLANLQKVCEAD